MTDDHALARDLAAEAGRRLLQLRARGGDPDVLRMAGDRLSHDFLAAELAGRRPGDVLLSEEGADNPARLTADRVWIVDPLDGTREFGEAGRTDWAVHVALWERGAGDLTVGAVALPAQGKVLGTARPSGPARAGDAERHRCHNDVAITTSLSQSRGWQQPTMTGGAEASVTGAAGVADVAGEVRPSDAGGGDPGGGDAGGGDAGGGDPGGGDAGVSDAGGGQGAPRRVRIVVSRTRAPRFVRYISDRIDAELVPLGSAGAKVAAVVAGEADAYVHGGGFYEWDTAAPVAVARAAGYHASRIDGSPLAYNQPGLLMPDILVCRPALATMLLEAIREVTDAH